MKKIFHFSLLVFFVLAGPALADLSEGLVAYYPFNGNANDQSGNGNHGIVNGATLGMDRNGNPNQAYIFDGNDYIEIPDSDSLDITDSITISAWVKQIDFYNGAIVSKGTNDSNDSYFLTANTPVRWHLNTTYGWQWFDGAEILALNEWYHVVVTFDGNRMRIFVNGTDNGYVWRSGNMIPNDYSVTIGKRGGNTHWWHGTLDEIRIYNRALSEIEIEELYSGTITDKYLDFFYVQNRIYEDGNNFQRISFAMRNESDEYVLDDVINTIQVIDPDGIQVEPIEAKFGGEYSIAYGGYDANNGRWYFDDSFGKESSYPFTFNSPLKPGFYQLIVTDFSDNQYREFKYFEGVQYPPKISTGSFCAFKDEGENLIWKWEIPSEKFSNLRTSIRTWVAGHASNGDYVGEIYLKVPTHMGWALVPANLLHQLEQMGSHTFKITVQTRTNNNNNRFYTADVDWQDANACGCDIDADRKTGLVEAIHSLQVVAGVK